MKLKLIIALLLFQLGFSQQKACGTDAQMQKIMSDPVAKQKYQDLQNRFKIELAKLQDPQNETARNSNATIIIPVAFHFPEVDANSPDRPCLRAMAQNQVDILNDAFNATNSDINLWTPQVQAFYPGTNLGNLNVSFVIANKNHPVSSGLSNGQQAITFKKAFLYTQNGDNRDIRWNGYLNIVVRTFTDGNAGYYAGGNPDEGNLVVLTKDAFASGPGCPGGYVPYWVVAKGRNAVHEVGHYFSVHHTFGKEPGANVCAPSNTDEVADTPQCLNTGGPWPVPGSVAGCIPGEKALSMNYMDYRFDDTKFMFTAGQVVRMRAYYNTVSSQFATNVLSNENFEFKDFALYPNPNNGSFKISFTPETNDDIEVSVYDISGRNIYNKTFDNSGLFEQELQIKTVSFGVYFVNIQNGENKMTKRILVE